MSCLHRRSRSGSASTASSKSGNSSPCWPSRSLRSTSSSSALATRSRSSSAGSTGIAATLRPGTRKEPCPHRLLQRAFLPNKCRRGGTHSRQFGAVLLPLIRVGFSVPKEPIYERHPGSMLRLRAIPAGHPRVVAMRSTIDDGHRLRAVRPNPRHSRHWYRARRRSGHHGVLMPPAYELCPVAGHPAPALSWPPCPDHSARPPSTPGGRTGLHPSGAGHRCHRAGLRQGSHRFQWRRVWRLLAGIPCAAS
jgi:hypothetical protein